MRVNGKQVELKERLTLEKFLESNGYALTKVAVELNGKIVPRKEYAATILQDTDALEIVCFVGGG
jgi:sulfur carrier protein